MADTALPAAVTLAAAFEGFRAKPYQDGGGVWTIGYGFTYLPDDSRVTSSTPAMTEADARAHLGTLMAAVLSSVRGMVYVSITDNQAAALADFAFNLGTGALRNSTLLRLLNSGETANAADQFGAWVYDAGRKVDGLIRRRAAEAALFRTQGGAPVAPAAPPVVVAADDPADDLNAAELNTINQES